MEKLKNFELKKGWQWMLYMDILFPAILFLGALLLKSSSFGVTLAKWFHSYCLYLINPIPDFATFTGVVGLVYPFYFFWQAARKRDWLDLGLCVALTGLMALCFWQEWNYLLVKLLSFGG
jgi:hypothetical protein